MRFVFWILIRKSYRGNKYLQLYDKHNDYVAPISLQNNNMIYESVYKTTVHY